MSSDALPERINAAAPSGELRADAWFVRMVADDSFAGSATETMEAALGLVAQPVFVLGPNGGLLMTNRAGRAELEVDRSVLGLCADAVAGVRSDPRVVSVTVLDGSGRSAMVVVVHEADPHAATLARVRAARALTDAETRVLGHVVRGDSNKEVAGKIGCAKRTVEVHATSLMRKCGFESRARLIAWFWTAG